MSKKRISMDSMSKGFLCAEHLEFAVITAALSNISDRMTTRLKKIRNEEDRKILKRKIARVEALAEESHDLVADGFRP